MEGRVALVMPLMEALPQGRQADSEMHEQANRDGGSCGSRMLSELNNSKQTEAVTF